MKTLFEHLLGYSGKGRVSFAMPGHKGGRGFSEKFSENIAKIDVTEIEDTENLHAPGEILQNAKKELSGIYKSKESYFLTGGSTEGIHIMLHTVYKRGKILVNRGCHRSVLNCCALSGTQPVFIEQEINPKLLIPEPPTAEKIAEMLKKHTDIDACLITSPSYYGQLADVEAIAKVCHEKLIPLLVDEAHGAHLVAKGISKGAMLFGADMVVQSAHKTLNALNQAAFLHINSELINTERAKKLTSMIGTTSPSYPIVASAQAAISELLGDEWRSLCDYIEEKRSELKRVSKIVMPEGECDPARIVFGFSSYNITGFQAEEIFRKRFGIDIEMADANNVVMIATISNTREEIDLLFDAARYIAENTPLSEGERIIKQPPFTEGVMSVREAFLSEGELVPLKDAVGRISKNTVSAYPPGIALIAFSEPVTREMTEYIGYIKNAGARIEGIDEQGRIEVVKVTK